MLGGNNSCLGDLDHQLSASVKKILLEQIHFKEATIVDSGDLLHQKYKPLNSGYVRPNIFIKQLNTSMAQGDIPKPSVILFDENRIENHWKSIRGVGPGLANLGNTCFLNSVLQVLTYTPPLVNYITSQHHKSKCKCIGFCMQCELSNHILRVICQNSSNVAVRPLSIIQKLTSIGKNFRFGRQEDAHEFLRYVIEGLQKSDYAGLPKLDKLSKETTVANAVFGGYYRSQVKCLHCKHESNTFDPIMDINLDIKDCSNILQALQKSVRPDRLDGDNKYFCERCRTKRVAQKKGTIHKEPNILTLQLKRFDFSKMFGGKISREVAFPDELDIRPFMSALQGPPIVYNLYAVLVHSGYSCNSGHYYCYIKASNGLWYEKNDNRVSQVGFHTVKNAQAYLLFYVKKTKREEEPSLNAAGIAASQNSQVTTQLTDKKYTQSNNSQYGTPVQRKSEARIVWNNINPQNSTGEKIKVEGLLKEKAQKLSAGMKKAVKINRDNLRSVLQQPGSLKTLTASQVTCTADVNTVPTTTTVLSKQACRASAKTDNNNSDKDGKNDSNAGKIMNSLERLSLSYAEDTDSTGSSAATSPSILSSKEGENIKSCNGQNDGENEKPDNDKNKANLHNETATPKTLYLPIAKETSPKMSPGRLKLTHGKYYPNSNTKFPVWSPVTKAALHPRVIIHKTLSENAEKNKDTHISPGSNNDCLKSSRNEKKEMKSTNQANAKGDGNPIGYVPPLSPSHAQRRRNDSMTSEASSIASVHSQSGDWEIYHKHEIANSPVVIHERQHVGWEVSPIKSHVKARSPGDVDNRDKAIDDSFSLQNDKNRKRKHSNVNDNYTEVQSFPRVEDDDNSPKKKKKKKDKKAKKKKQKKVRSDSEDSACSVAESPEEDSSSKHKSKKRKKKSKKKHKRYRSDSEDDIQTKSLPEFTRTILEDKHKPLSTLQEKQTPKYLNDNDYANSTSHHAKKSRKKRTNYEERSSEEEPDSHCLHYDDETKTKPFLLKDEEKIEIKKNVPTHRWDDVKKNATAWDGSAKSNVLDYISETKVSNWSGDNDSKPSIYSMKNRDDGEQGQDDYDEEYDEGRVKKKKAYKHENLYQEDSNRNALNPFQHLQDYRNFSKDKHASHRQPLTKSHHRHRHSDKHKVRVNHDK